MEIAINVISEAAEIYYAGVKKMPDGIGSQLSFNMMHEIFNTMVIPAIERARALDREHISTAALLAEIISRNGTQGGPDSSKYLGEWVEVTVPIGQDDTAEIRMPAESLIVLNNLSGWV